MSKLPRPEECGFETTLEASRRILATRLKESNGKAVQIACFELHPHTDDLLSELDGAGWTYTSSSEPGEGTTYEISPKKR